MIREVRKIYWALLIAALIGVGSCIDPIDFDVPAGVNSSIVVQGRVVLSEPSFVEVNISRLFDFTPESRQPVSVRKVALYDDRNNEMILETDEPGSYYQVLDNSTPISAAVGTGYRVRIETFSGQIFESTSDILPEGTDPIDLNVSIVQEFVKDPLDRFVPVDRVRLSIDTEINKDNNGGVYWEVNNVFKFTDSPPDTTEIKMKTCYLNKLTDVNDIYVLDPENVEGTVARDVELSTSPIDFRFSEGLYYEVHQYSLSQGAFLFWRGINILSEREGNMFDGPVGEVPTNFIDVNETDQFIFGYFFATQETIIRKRVPQELVGNPDPFCPPGGPAYTEGGDCRWGLCCDCLADESATVIQPSFWID